MIIAVNFQFKQLARRSQEKKNQGFKGIRTRDLRVAGVLLYQLVSGSRTSGCSGDKTTTPVKKLKILPFWGACTLQPPRHFSVLLKSAVWESVSYK